MKKVCWLDTDVLAVNAAAKGTLSEETVQMFLRQIGNSHLSCYWLWRLVVMAELD